MPWGIGPGRGMTKMSCRGCCDGIIVSVFLWDRPVLLGLRPRHGCRSSRTEKVTKKTFQYRPLVVEVDRLSSRQERCLEILPEGIVAQCPGPNGLREHYARGRGVPQGERHSGGVHPRQDKENILSGKIIPFKIRGVVTALHTFDIKKRALRAECT